MPRDGEETSMNGVARRSAFIALALTAFALPASAQVDQRLAQQYFREAQALCERDGGRLWGVSICAPMVIYDRATQTIATSHPQPAGPLPQLLGFVNAPLKWGDTTWAAFVWDFFPGRPPRRRKELLLHEMFHGVQAQVGVAAQSLAAEHLDQMEGRYWLRLEWRALDRALGTAGDERKEAVRDALAFRQAHAPRRSRKDLPRTRRPHSLQMHLQMRSRAPATCSW
jgi:hypothetical protein